MLPSSKRLTIPLFKGVMDKGRIFHSPFFSAKMLKTEGMSRFSVAVSKKVAKNAIDRNKIRRRIYSTIRPLYPRIIPGIHGVIMPKSTVLKGTFAEKAQELEIFFVKMGILK
jgi:ribonuclease P protein component